MNDERLEELLTAAGRGNDPPIEPRPGLADCVLRLHTRRRNARRATAAGVATMLVVAAAVSVRYFPRDTSPRGPVEQPMADVPKGEPQDSPGPSEDAEIELLRAEVERLRAEAQQREALVADLLDRQRVRDRLDELQRELHQPDPVDLARVEFEKAAFLMIEHADRRSTSNDDARADAYRRTIELFPNTDWAEVARERLGQTLNDEGEL